VTTTSTEVKSDVPKKPNSHDYAQALRRAADFFLSRPAFDIDSDRVYSFSYFRFYDKEQFIAAAKALGTGKKAGDDRDIEFQIKAPGNVEITISAPRSTVCRLIRPAEYDCDPFLSPDEEKLLGGAA
jgi:hypothetical protein